MCSDNLVGLVCAPFFKYLSPEHTEMADLIKKGRPIDDKLDEKFDDRLNSKARAFLAPEQTEASTLITKAIWAVEVQLERAALLAKERKG